MSLICRVCNYHNRLGASFCIACATSLALAHTCPQCGLMNPPAARYCERCAQPLAPGLVSHQSELLSQVTSPPAILPTSGILVPGVLLQERFEILRLLGQGGMGAVYLAVDLVRSDQTERYPVTVTRGELALKGRQAEGHLWAIKELSAANLNILDRPTAIATFQREVSLLSRLSHPNLPFIPPIGNFFTEGGKWYFVMEYIQGETLESHVQSLTPGAFLPVDDVLGWAAQICSVLDYLHLQEPPIIFRDLSPDNIMVTAEGVIKLIDFGIARAFQPGQRNDTQPLGKPGYSPPEQYGRAQTDPRSDIYALGATLLRLFTNYDPGLSPFTLPPARLRNASLPEAIENAIKQAVSLDREKRPATAREMWHMIAGRTKPSSTPIPSQSRLEHPWPLELFQPFSASDRHEWQSRGENLVDTPSLTPGLLGQSRITGRPDQIPSRPTSDGHEVPLPMLLGLPVRGQLQVTRLRTLPVAPVHGVAWSPDDRFIAAASTQKTITLWLVNKRDPLLTLSGHNSSARSVAWSPDSQVLASGADDGLVLLWEAKTGRRLCELAGHHRAVFNVAWSPDGQRLASAGEDQQVIIWSGSTGRSLITLKHHSESVQSVGWSPDGRNLASASVDQTLIMWDVASGQPLSRMAGHRGPVYGISWSPDGRWLASAGADRSIIIWDAPSGEARASLIGHNDRVNAVSWSPTGQLLASASSDRTIKLWESASGRCLETLTGHSDKTTTISWSPDGEFLLSGALDKNIIVWQVYIPFTVS